MKGGRTAPRDLERTAAQRPTTLGFNEGGADCPPRPFYRPPETADSSASMKGGRTAPRDEAEHSGEHITNTASMKGGRTAPRDPIGTRRTAAQCRASMKGGRTAPRDCAICTGLSAGLGFNEGGADCPPRLLISLCSSLQS